MNFKMQLLSNGKGTQTQQFKQMQCIEMEWSQFISQTIDINIKWFQWNSYILLGAICHTHTIDKLSMLWFTNKLNQ